MKSESVSVDIAILGGGLVGASLAAALKHSGLSLALVESQSSLMTEPAGMDDWDSRIYAISPGSRAFLEQSGAWGLMDVARIAPVEGMHVFGDAGAELDFNAYEMGVGELACIVENRALHQALWQVLLHQENLTLLNPVRCTSLQVGDDGAALALEDGRTVNAKLVVGADGRDSWVRNQAGMGVAPVEYQQHGVVANFVIEKPHRGIAHQWFQSDGILALLPLPGERVSMVWSVSPEKSAELLKLSPKELAARVAEAAQQVLGEMRVITPPAAFPLRLLILPRVVAPRIALIGDAAHNMHPLAGQGVNPGFRDARQLVQVLNERGAQDDCGNMHLLRRYERNRREDIYTMQATTYGLKHLFNNEVALLRSLRNVGLDAVNRVSPLKKLLVQQALG